MMKEREKETRIARELLSARKIQERFYRPKIALLYRQAADRLERSTLTLSERLA